MFRVLVFTSLLLTLALANTCVSPIEIVLGGSYTPAPQYHTGTETAYCNPSYSTGITTRYQWFSFVSTGQWVTLDTCIGDGGDVDMFVYSSCYEFELGAAGSCYYFTDVTHTGCSVNQRASVDRYFPAGRYFLAIRPGSIPAGSPVYTLTTSTVYSSDPTKETCESTNELADPTPVVYNPATTAQITKTMCYDDGDLVQGKWFSFYGTGNEMLLSTCHSTTTWDTFIEVYEDCGETSCSAEIYSNNDSPYYCEGRNHASALFLDTELSTQYYAMVSAYDSSAVTTASSFYFQVGSYCTSPTGIEITVNDTHTSTTDVIGGVATVTATTSASTAVETTKFYKKFSPGHWYSFMGTGDVMPVHTCSGEATHNLDTVIEVLSTCSPSEDVIAWNDDALGNPAFCSSNTGSSAVFVQTEVRTEYHVFVHSPSLSVTGTYSIQVGSGCRKSLSTLFQLTETGAPVVRSFNTSNHFYGDNLVEATESYGVFSKGMWYSFKGNGYVVPITTCHPNTDTSVDTVIEVYDSCDNTRPSSRVTWGLNSDGMEAPLCSIHDRASTVYVPTFKGVPLYVFVHSRSMSQSGLLTTQFGSFCPSAIIANTTLPYYNSYFFTPDKWNMTEGHIEATEAYNSFSRGYWVKYSAAQTERIPVHTCLAGTTSDTVIEVFPNCKSSSFESRLAFNDDADGFSAPQCDNVTASSIFLDVTAGLTYMIFVHGQDMSVGAGEVYARLRIGGYCYSATEMNHRSFHEGTVAVDIRTETTEAYNKFTQGFWISFNGTGNVVPVHTCSLRSVMNTVIEVFPSCFSSRLGDRLAFNDNADYVEGPLCSGATTASAVYVPTVSGQKYKVFVHGTEFNDATNATVWVGSGCPASTVIAFPNITSGFVDTTTMPEATEAYGVFSLGHWYIFAGTGNVVPVHTCSLSAMDTVIEVFDTCSNTKLHSRVAFNEDADFITAPLCGPQKQASAVYVPTIAGSTYYVFVHGAYMSYTFGYVMTTGSGCTVARSLTDRLTSNYGFSPLATPLNLVNGIIEATEAYNVFSKGFWYNFSSGATGGIIPIHTCHDLTTADTVIEVFPDCKDTTLENRLAYNDNANFYEGARCGAHETASVVFLPTVANTQYRVFVHGTSMANSVNNLVLRVGGYCTFEATTIIMLNNRGTADAANITIAFYETTQAYNAFTRGYWYSFVSTFSDVIPIHTCNENTTSTTDTVIEVFPDCKSSRVGERLAFNDNADYNEGSLCSSKTSSSVVYLPTVAGTTYKVFVHGRLYTTGDFEKVRFGSGCRSAATFGTLYRRTLFGTNGTEDSSPPEATEAYRKFSRGNWHSFVGDGKMVPVHTCSRAVGPYLPPFDNVIEVFHSCVNTKLDNRIVFNQDADFMEGPWCSSRTKSSAVYVPTVSGTTYYVFVHGYDMSAQGDYFLTIGSGCNNHIDLTGNLISGVLPLNNYSTVFDYNNASAPSQLITEATEAYNIFSQGVWFSLIGNGNVVPITTCSTETPTATGNTVIEVFDSTCTNTDLQSRLAWNDNADGTTAPLCSNNLRSAVVLLPTRNSVEYRVFVHGETMSDTPAVYLNTGSYCGNDLKSTNPNTLPDFYNFDYNHRDFVEPSEAYNMLVHGYWVDVVAMEEGGVIPIHTCHSQSNDTDTVIEVFSSCHDTRLSSRLAFNDDANLHPSPKCNDNTEASVVYLPTYADETYRVFVHGVDTMERGNVHLMIGSGCYDAATVSWKESAINADTNDVELFYPEATQSWDYFAHGFWYVFDGTGDVVPIQTCNAHTDDNIEDTVIEVYDTCASTTKEHLVALSDDLIDDGTTRCASAPWASSVFVDTVEGQEYYVFVHGIDMDVDGEYVLRLGSNCRDATEIELPSTVDADTGDFNEEATQAFNVYSKGGWWKFTGTGARVPVHTCNFETNDGVYDTIIEVFDTCKNTRLESRVAWNDDASNDVALDDIDTAVQDSIFCAYDVKASSLFLDTELNQDYYIFVHAPNTEINGDFRLQVGTMCLEVLEAHEITELPYYISESIDDAPVETTECYGQFTQGYWYHLVGIGADVTISTQQLWHAVIEVFDTCMDTSCDSVLATSEEETKLDGTTLVSSVTFYSEEGQDYYLFVHGLTMDDSGDIEISGVKKSCHDKKNELRLGALYQLQK